MERVRARVRVRMDTYECVVVRIIDNKERTPTRGLEEEARSNAHNRTGWIDRRIARGEIDR